MKILTFMGLSPRLVDSQVKPLIISKNTEHIFIVRNSLGPTQSKVIYQNPPKLITKFPLLNIIYKIIFGTYLISKVKPKIIISFYLVPHGLLAFFCAKITGKPLCLSLLGTDLNVHCRKRFFGKILIWIMKHSNFITVPGSLSKKFLIDNGVIKTKIFVLPNTIDMKEFHPISIIKSFDIISIGRLIEEKHIDILLKIILKLKESHPDIKVSIAGSGPERPDLEKLRSTLNLEKNVEFSGFVEDANLFINSGKIYVLTSESEGLPTAMVEAMACGLACVVSRVGNIPDVAIDGKNSYVIDNYQDIESYVKKISKLLKDEKSYHMISSNALEIRKNYSVENATRVWDKIFNKLQLS